MSPERYLGNNYNASTDIWSFGMVILECVTGQYPFKEGRDLNNENG
jgi:serine/threonine protein kinase